MLDGTGFSSKKSSMMSVFYRSPLDLEKNTEMIFSPFAKLLNSVFTPL